MTWFNQHTLPFTQQTIPFKDFQKFWHVLSNVFQQQGIGNEANTVKQTAMNKYIQQKLAMYNVVRQLMEQNATSWNSIPILDGVFSDFNAKITELDDLAIKQNTKLTGYAKTKSKLRVVTIEQTIVISGALSFYAETIGDDVLLAKVRLKAYDVNRAGKEQLLTIVEAIMQVANELSAELLPIGITQVHLDDLSANFEELKEQMYGVRMEIIKRKQLTATISKICRETDTLLSTGLDRLIKVVKSVDPNFYYKYTSARMIMHYGAKHKVAATNPGKPNGFLGA